MKLLTVQQVATRLGVAVPTVTLWCRQKKFRNAIKLPGDTNPWLIPERDVERFVPPRKGRPPNA